LKPANDLQMLKEHLHAFAQERVGAPHGQNEADFGELLLYLIQLADHIGVDLMAAGEKIIERRATGALVLVPNR
jgi:hypothetical protein